MQPSRPPGSLPPAAIALLQRAAQTPIPAHDPLARIVAIEKATQRVKCLFPQFFIKEFK